MTALIVLLVIVAFIAARIMRSTRLWWACVIAIMAGLLTGITSKFVISDSDDENTAVITNFSSTQDNHMQSALDLTSMLFNDDEVAGYVYSEESERLDGYSTNPLEVTREPPAIEDDS